MTEGRDDYQPSQRDEHAYVYAMECIKDNLC